MPTSPVSSARTKTTTSSDESGEGPSARTRSKSKRPLTDITNTFVGDTAASSSTTKTSVKKAKKNARKAEPVLTPTIDSEGNPAQEQVEARSYMQREPNDIDAMHRDNPLMCSQYANGYHAHCRQNELKFQVDANYLTQQPHLNADLRRQMIERLELLHAEFKLVPETLHLSVSLLDRFLMLYKISAEKLLLVGVTCLLLAIKFEEVQHFPFNKFILLHNCAFTRRDLVRSESCICRVLEHQLAVPTIYHFLCRYVRATQTNDCFLQLACFLGERVLHEYSMLQFLPSVVAATIVRACRRTLRLAPWSPTLLTYTLYDEDALEDCAVALRAVLLQPLSRHSLLYKKYSSSNFLKVARIVVEV